MQTENEKRQRSQNADGSHVHTPESGRNPDDALAPGNTSGSGDVEHAQRKAAMIADKPLAGGESREPTANSPQPGLSEEDNPAGTDASPPSGARVQAATAPRPGLDQTTVENDPAVDVRAPEGDSKKQLKRIEKRNEELTKEDAEPGPEGEREINGGQSVRSVPSQTGDYASD